MNEDIFTDGDSEVLPIQMGEGLENVVLQVREIHCRPDVKGGELMRKDRVYLPMRAMSTGNTNYCTAEQHLAT